MTKRGISTRAIHGRERRHGDSVPLVEPIVPATAFSFDRSAQLARVLAEDEYGFGYSRHRNPTVEELNAVLADLEGAEAAQATGSGMAAIRAALLSNLEPGDTLLASRQLYGTTYALLERRLRPLGVDVVYADLTDLAAWMRPAKIRYAETIVNPGFPLGDIEALAATKGDGLLVVDNTFASPALCRPLELGADIVCESATKFLNGHHDVTAGVLAGSEALVGKARRHLLDTGGELDPFGAFLLRRGLKTLGLRMERHSANALALARFLARQPRIEAVFYAGLPSFAQYRLALRQLTDSGGILAVVVTGGREGAEQVMDALELSHRATSLGGVDTLVSHPASTSHRQLDEEQLAAAGIAPGLVRISVGCEDADDIVADWEQALGRA